MHLLTTIRVIFLVALLGAMPPTFSWATAPDDVAVLSASLDRMARWVEADPANGQRWHAFLRTEELRHEIQRLGQADPAVVARVLQQYQSGASGLETGRFVAVRSALQTWLQALKLQYTGDLEKLAWASRGDHLPLTAERFQPIRIALRDAAGRLQTKLGQGSELADGWNRYLKWDLLAGHLAGEAKINSQALRDLDVILKKFRANEPGLELPVFTQTATALQRYRALITWATLAQQTRDVKRRDTRPLYEKTMRGLQQQIQMQQEAATPETTWRLGHSLGLLRHLNQSPELVRGLRAQFEQPNVFLEISQQALNRVAARPVSKGKPVRDVILGAQVRGWANSYGNVSFRTLPAYDHVELEVLLAGNIHSNTVSSKKPVRVTSSGNTSFSATKQLLISDDRFTALGALASTETHSTIHSVRKTGGRFGRRLIERIAWKKVCQSKSQAEAAASRSAKRQVAQSFDQELSEALTGARRNYEQRLRPPLVRRGAFPEHLRMFSTSQSVCVEATLATIGQLSSDSPPPELRPGHDITMRVHQSTLDNYLPLVLAGAILQQDSADQPPQLKGNIPSWMKKLSFAYSQSQKLVPLANAALWSSTAKTPVFTPVAFVENAKEETKKAALPKFKPWRIKLHEQRPVSVTLDQQRVTIRIRTEEIRPDKDEEPLKHWDFIVAYEVVQDGNGILLRRVGAIEVFPTGFDPRWTKKNLTAKQLGTRNNIARNMNQRAEAGEGFPAEIPIKPIQIPVQGGIEQTLLLEQLDCNGGWLTIGWRLP